MKGPGRESRFAILLRQYREAAGMSANTLARRVCIDPSYITRMERGERDPARRPIVQDICHVLGLKGETADSLLAAAGYVPDIMAEAVARMSRYCDPALQEVLAVLEDTRYSEQGLQAFRATITAICQHWSWSDEAELRGKTVSIEQALATKVVIGGEDERQPSAGAVGAGSGNSGSDRRGGAVEALPDACGQQRHGNGRFGYSDASSAERAAL